jgi:hypothetical protein
MKKFGQNHFEIWIDIFVFEFWKKKLVIENGKIEKKKSILKFGLKFEKMKYVTKIWNEKIENFHI